MATVKPEFDLLERYITTGCMDGDVDDRTMFVIVTRNADARDQMWRELVETDDASDARWTLDLLRKSQITPERIEVPVSAPTDAQLLRDTNYQTLQTNVLTLQSLLDQAHAKLAGAEQEMVELKAWKVRHGDDKDLVAENERLKAEVIHLSQVIAGTDEDAPFPEDRDRPLGHDD